MPRMSKKRRLEWSFFLNHRNRITYNDLCRGCTRDCKQSFRAVIILCPRYYSKRWKKEDAAKKAPKKGIPDYTCKEGESL